MPKNSKNGQDVKQMKEKKIILIENKLLKKEKYLKRVKRVAIELILIIITIVIIIIFKKPEILYEYITHIYISLPILIFWWWEAHLQIRHINSIKYYRKMSPQKDVTSEIS